ncbi:MAG: hypothetical protein ABIM40_14705, partial [Pseudomonadota bacterium]
GISFFVQLLIFFVPLGMMFFRQAWHLAPEPSWPGQLAGKDEKLPGTQKSDEPQFPGNRSKIRVICGFFCF